MNYLGSSNGALEAPSGRIALGIYVQIPLVQCPVENNSKWNAYSPNEIMSLSPKRSEESKAPRAWTWSHIVSSKPPPGRVLWVICQQHVLVYILLWVRVKLNITHLLKFSPLPCTTPRAQSWKNTMYSWIMNNGQASANGIYSKVMLDI
jgi:hypothetical protein